MLSTVRRDERGFTLTELLVVLVILSILAAIGIALFVSQRSKAQDAEAKTAATMVTEALMVYHQERDTFAGADRVALARYEPQIANVRGLVVDGDADRFEISVDSAAEHGGGPFVVEHEAGGTERRCLAPGQGGCPDSGLW